MPSGNIVANAIDKALTRRPTLNLLANLTAREISSQYKRTALGRIWSLINPIANIAIYSLIFSVLFKMQVPDGTQSHLSGQGMAALWMASGIIPWGFITNAIGAGMGSLRGNAGLLTKVYFPRSVLVTSTLLATATTFLTELAALSVILIAFGGPRLLLRIPELLLIVALTTVFAEGIALVLSLAVVYFGDIQHLWSIFSQVWFYASGVVFPISVVANAQTNFHLPLVAIFEFNPAYQFIAAYRAVLWDFGSPTWHMWLSMCLWAAVSVTLGALFFKKHQAGVVEEL